MLEGRDGPEPHGGRAERGGLMAGRADSIEAGVRLAEESVDLSRAGYAMRFIERTNDLALLPDEPSRRMATGRGS